MAPRLRAARPPSNAVLPAAFAMSGKHLEEAFRRHPRPQKAKLPVPTAASLLEKAQHVATRDKEKVAEITRPKPVLPSLSTKARTILPHAYAGNRSIAKGARNDEETRTWDDFRRIGVLVQGDTHWIISSPQQCLTSLYMFKKSSKQTASHVKEILEKISHPNILSLQYFFAESEDTYIGFHFCRFTLGELIKIEASLEEPQIQLIACSIFGAIKHLSRMGIAHGDVTVQNIRISGFSGGVYLTNFESASHWRSKEPSVKDLQGLGFVLLDCMDGCHRPDLKDVQYVIDQRSKNKVFGLRKAEKWSGCKQLVDFLDDIFNVQKSTVVKFEKPHDFVSRESVDSGCMRAFLELAPLECFDPWLPAD